MPSQEVDVVKLPRRGLALIASDLHGNLKDFHKLLQIWQNTPVKDKHLIFIGDFIHAMGTKEADNSLELLEEQGMEFKALEPPRELGTDKVVTLENFFGRSSSE